MQNGYTKWATCYKSTKASMAVVLYTETIETKRQNSGNNNFALDLKWELVVHRKQIVLYYSSIVPSVEVRVYDCGSSKMSKIWAYKIKLTLAEYISGAAGRRLYLYFKGQVSIVFKLQFSLRQIILWQIYNGSWSDNPRWPNICSANENSATLEVVQPTNSCLQQIRKLHGNHIPSNMWNDKLISSLRLVSYSPRPTYLSYTIHIVHCCFATSFRTSQFAIKTTKK